MFNFHSVDTLEIDGSSQVPEAPVLSIDAGEDINALTWNSPYFTNFFKIYWSANPFTSADEPGVKTIANPAIPGATPETEVSYSHTIPSAFGLSVLYYRVSAYNANGESLSNQVDSSNFRLAIYEALYNKTVEDLTLRFTPEIRKQYEDSKLWRSFVQSLCSEMAQSRFEIKEALKQLNLQKAVNVFLNMWNDVTGISRINVPVAGSTTGEVIPETDAEYRQRLVDSVFWDKVSNLALKKTMLLKLGYDASIVDSGSNPLVFREVPERSTPKYQANFGLRFIPYTTPGWNNIEVFFARIGPSSKARVHPNGSTGTEAAGGTLSYHYYDWDYDGTPYREVTSIYHIIQQGTKIFFISAATTNQPPGADDMTGTELFIDHDAMTMYNAASPSNSAPGDTLYFWPSGATGKLVDSDRGVLTFELTAGSVTPQEWDWVNNYPKQANWLLIGNTQLVTSADILINPKRLSNRYSVDLPAGTLDDAPLNEIYNEISPLAALGNVLTEILQDVSLDFEDWDKTYGNIRYGRIFFGAETQSGVKSTESNWAVSEEIFMDNQRVMDGSDKFYGNDGPDDIVILKRIT